MRITKLTADNFKILKAVEITPDGNVVEIRGQNDNGKTSVLDSIAAALGGKDLCPTVPIRRGEDHAKVSVELDAELTATRVWKLKADGSVDSHIEVTTKDGARHRSPQAVLDALTSSLSFDPLAFTAYEPKKQQEVLKKLSGVDVDDLTAAYKKAYDERTIVNREHERLVLAIPAVVTGAPEKEESVAELLDAQERARLEKIANDQQRDRLKKARDDFDATAKGIAAMKVSLAAATTAVANEEKKLADLLALGKSLSGEVKKLKDPDLAGLAERAKTLEARNALVRQVKRRDEAQAQALAKSKEAEALTAKLEALAKEKVARISKAKMPVEGLGFSEGGITLNGLPFEQSGAAERLRVSLAMGLALNPKLRVLLIRDGSLLDKKHMAIVAEMATKADAQVWVEVVDDSNGPGGIIIEDGLVRGAVPAPVQEEKKSKRKAKEVSGTNEASAPAAGSESNGGEVFDPPGVPPTEPVAEAASPSPSAESDAKDEENLVCPF